MNQPTIPDFTGRDITSVPTPELKQALAQAIGITAKTLAYLADIWRELEARGEDLSSLRSGLMMYMPLIAAGRLEPELVVRCAGQAMLLKSAAEIPLEQQRQLLEHGAVIAQVGDDGDVTEITKPLDRLTAHDVRLLFSAGGIRPAADQIVMQQNRPKRAAKNVIVKLQLTEDEYRRLRKAAVLGRKNTPVYVRDMLKKWGAI